MEAFAHASPHRILIAEDDRGIRVLLEQILSQEGRSLLLAGDGAEAVALALQHPVDLLLVDLHMPALDGAAVCRAYRAAGGAAPVVLLSASANGTDTARECDADGFIAKPFRVATVLETVDRFVGPHWSATGCRDHRSPEGRRTCGMRPERTELFRA